METRTEIRIFIVEDDFIFSSILTQIIDTLNTKFNSKGIDIVYNSFYSAKEASYQLSKNPAIILLDYYIIDDNLEPETATSFLRNVKLFDPDIDVVVVSGQEDKEVIDVLKKQGATAYIGKDPLSMQKLEPTLEELISRRFL